MLDCDTTEMMLMMGPDLIVIELNLINTCNIQKNIMGFFGEVYRGIPLNFYIYFFDTGWLKNEFG